MIESVDIVINWVSAKARLRDPLTFNSEGHLYLDMHCH